MIEVRPAKVEDIQSLKDRLRGEDAEEVLAAGNQSVESCLVYSFTRSATCLTVGLDGVPVAMFGVIPDDGDPSTANVWFLGSKEMGYIKKSFVKQSRRYIKEFLGTYKRLWNTVDGRYDAAIKWLLSCGAIFHERPIMSRGVAFYLFEFRGA